MTDSVTKNLKTAAAIDYNNIIIELNNNKMCSFSLYLWVKRVLHFIFLHVFVEHMFIPFTRMSYLKSDNLYDFVLEKIIINSAKFTYMSSKDRLFFSSFTSICYCLQQENKTVSRLE